jgi:hypothetical protein
MSVIPDDGVNNSYSQVSIIVRTAMYDQFGGKARGKETTRKTKT